MQRKLTVSVQTFFEMVSKLVESGVTFEAEETANDQIIITFTGGF